MQGKAICLMMALPLLFSSLPLQATVHRTEHTEINKNLRIYEVYPCEHMMTVEYDDDGVTSYINYTGLRKGDSDYEGY